MNSYSPTTRHSYKITISCAGLGMGNASRCCAIIESLYQKAKSENATISCQVISWGAGFLFIQDFKNNTDYDFELHELRSYRVENSLIKFIKNYFWNTKVLKSVINRFKPDLIILDSDYHLLSYFNLKIPRISIGQASDVLERVETTHYKASNFTERVNLLFREQLDAFFQCLTSTKVLVPSFALKTKTKSNCLKVPLIVRNEFLGPTIENTSGDSIGVLLSGSEIDKGAFLKLQLEHSFEIITPAQNSKILSHANFLDKYDIIFTQGGLSSISEVIARNKFLVVFPIKNHPEQLINALEVEQRGLGIKSSLEELEDFSSLLKKIQIKKATAKRVAIDCTGAERSAEIILSFLITR